jgi:RNA polymerase sigma factor (sigma-70 family)
MGQVAGGVTTRDLEAVYRRRLSELRRVATAITGDRESALDAVQEGFARAIRQRASFRGEGSVEAWVWRIVVNAARTTATATSGGLDAALAESNGDSPAAEVERSPVYELVCGLPERQRLALFLRYYADLDYATIAQALEVAPGTVGATLSQARDALRTALEEAR